MQKNSGNRANGPGFGPGSGNGPGSQMGRPKERANNVKATLKVIWAYLKEDKRRLIIVTVSTFITTILNIYGPYLMKDLIDGFSGRTLGRERLLSLLLTMGLVSLTAFLFGIFQQWIVIGISQRVVKRIRNDLFHKLQTLTISFFDKRKTGDLMSSVTNDIDGMSNTLSTSFFSLIVALQSIIFSTVVMFYLNWQLALICLSVIPMVVFITKGFAKYIRKGFKERQKTLAEINGIIEENISGFNIVKAFTKEDELLEKFSRKNRQLRDSANKANIFSGFMGPIMNLMNNINFIVTVFAGALLSVHGMVSIGTIVSFLTYTKQFSRPLNQIAQLYTSIQAAIAGAERVFAIMNTEPEFDDDRDSISLKDVKGNVEFRNLCFNYVKDVPVLKGIDISVKSGETVAIVGPTGAGKTTIINLLTRFYDFHRGSITIDGINIKSIQKRDLRKKLGIVLQDTFLFSDTVLENIRYGNLDVSDEEVISAAKLANAHQFIHRLPKGYHTEVSEDGGNLSQGQKQLIAIARAILSDPSILILDEATSSVDTRTEIHIQEGMLKLMEGRTSFVIAHRLSTIINADNILVMSDGKIVEQGKHSELMDKGGFYSQLYNSQFTLSLPS